MKFFSVINSLQNSLLFRWKSRSNGIFSNVADIFQPGNENSRHRDNVVNEGRAPSIQQRIEYWATARNGIPEEELDELTAFAIAEALYQDSTDYRSKSKGKEREDVLSDHQIAWQINEEEIMRMLQENFDRQIALEEAKAEENMISSQGVTSIAETMNKHHNELNTVSLTEFTASESNIMEDMKNFDFWLEEGYNVAESSRAAERRVKKKPQPSHECVVCLEKKPSHQVIQVTCGHHYCQVCLKELFNRSVRDEFLFPPACCNERIALTSVIMILGPELVDKFYEKETEFNTKDRTYCHQSSCSAFVSPQSIDKANGRATCLKCGLSTCTICKSRAHSGDCPKDKGQIKLNDAAKKNGWKRCYNCTRWIELKHGCNHITYAISLPHP